MNSQIVNLSYKFIDPIPWAKTLENQNKSYLKVIFSRTRWKQIEIRYIMKKNKIKHSPRESISIRYRYIIWQERKNYRGIFNYTSLPFHIMSDICKNLNSVDLLAMFYAFPYHREVIANVLRVHVREREFMIYRVQLSLSHVIYNQLREIIMGLS